MDSTSRLLIKQNEELIKNLDLNVLKPYLRKSGIFTYSMLRDIFSPDSEFDLISELPSRGPHAFSRFLKVLDEAGYEIEANNLRNGPKVGSVFYPMKSQPLGYCIIINNVHFYKDNIEVESERREGSLVDAGKLKEFFEKRGYVVEKRDDLKREAMIKCLKDLAISEVLKIVDAFLVIILSHGCKYDVLNDTHFAELRKQEVYDIFNNVNCENLKKKPKIFLFQACRGKDGDSGIITNESSDSLIFSEPNYNYTAESTDALDFNASSTENSYGANKLPTLSDMLVVHSSLPGYASYLDRFDGSWLVQELLFVFVRDYQVQDLESMLKTVCRKIQDRLSLKGQKKQVIHVETFGFRALLHICSNKDYIGPNKQLISYLRN